MKRVGITGGIGSGKSTVCQALQDMYGVPVYYADARAKTLMQEDASVRSKIETLFGEEAYCGGKLNREFIASKVFNDGELLHELNKAVHGAVRHDFEQWTAAQNAPYVVCEAAILIESGWCGAFDTIVVVEAPMELRIERVMQRDHVTRRQVEARISKQLSDKAREAYADIIVTADGSREVAKLVENLHRELTEK